MISPVSNAPQAQAHAAVQPSPAAQPARATAPRAAVTDTVQLSSAAKIQQEAIESPVQTAKEAASGDRQAKALLAREAADHASIK
jgi:hypothetical protein